MEIGEWSLIESGKSGLKYVVNEFLNDRVIYSFSSEEEILYIGICDKYHTTLKDRMNRYKYISGAGQNKRIVNNIKDILKDGKRVIIHALIPRDIKYTESVHIDMVKGLEYPLIEIFKPTWNK